MDFYDGCMICLESYSYSNSPKLVPCGHSMCSLCIGSIKAEYGICPYCRTPFRAEDIVPNSEFIKILIKEDIKNLTDIKNLFTTRLSEVVEVEMIKQQEIFETINDLERGISECFNTLRQQFTEIIDDSMIKQHQILKRIDDEINVLSNILSMNKGYSMIDDVKSATEKIKTKYINDDINIKLKQYQSGIFIQEIKDLAVEFSTKLKKLELALVEIPIFSTKAPLVEMSFFQPKTAPDKFNFGNLFDPLPGLLNIYNMKRKCLESFSHNLITQDSKCYQLHHNTVCLVTESHLLYIDIEKNHVATVALNKKIQGFCLARYLGDLAMIGGEEIGDSLNSRKRAHYRERRRVWVSLGLMNIQRMHATAESIGSRYIYVIGGNPDMSIELYNGEK
jgi:RING-finger-containing E3 ubiquitin ligase